MTRHKLSDGRGGAALAIRVTPRASRNEIVEILPDNTIKIRLTAPPIDGKANEALIEFLSKVLSVPKTRIDIVAGQTGRDKLVTIIDMDSSEAQELILKQMES